MSRKSIAVIVLLAAALGIAGFGYWLTRSDAGRDFELKGAAIDDPLIGGSVGAAMRKGDPLAAEINAAIKALRENGAYKAINDKYFAFDVYGG